MSSIAMVIINKHFYERLKKKDDERPRVERELSDAYIDSISRTPRYDLGRHNTYDDMLGEMDAEDPFKGEYKPSGKSPKLGDQRKLASQHKRHQDEDVDEELERSRSKKKARKKKKKKDEEASATAESYTNKAFKSEVDRESVKSNGTYTLNEQQKTDVRSSITNLAAAVLKKKPTKVKSIANIVSKREEMDNVSSNFFSH